MKRYAIDEWISCSISLGWPAGCAVFLVLLSAGVWLYILRTRQLNRKIQTQRQIIELERSALQAQMNPHFIFNCLNSVQNYILQNEKEAAVLYLGRLSSLIRSILEASVSGTILLSEELKLLNNYLELEKLRFNDRFTFKVGVADGLDPCEVAIPPLLVQPLVENALLHGLSARARDGRVTVLFDKKEGFLEVSIQDNGVGMPCESDKEKVDCRGHKPFGMSITRHRLELLSKSKENNCLHTKTLFNEYGQVAGTQVVIRIGIPDEPAAKQEKYETHRHH